MSRLSRVVNTSHRKMPDVVAYSERSRRNGHWLRAVTYDVHSTRSNRVGNALVLGVMLFFFLTPLCNTLSSSYTQLEVAGRVERSVSRQGRIWVHADSQVEEEFLPVRQYSRSLHDFHGTFYTGFRPSTSRKCVTGRKTLGFFMNHVNVVLLLCLPLQAIATVPP